MSALPKARTVNPAGAIANPNYGQDGEGSTAQGVDRVNRDSATGTTLKDSSALYNFDNPTKNAIVRNRTPFG